jgi:hypothetical protein
MVLGFKRKENYNMKRGASVFIGILLVLSAGAWALAPFGGGCHYTPGYWKNHAEVWPTTTIYLGGVAYNQDQLLSYLMQPVRGDATVILAHHLIAAILNVDNGGDMSVSDCINNAQEFLVAHPIGSDPQGLAREQALGIKDCLAAYNEFIVPGCK